MCRLGEAYTTGDGNSDMVDGCHGGSKILRERHF